MSLESPSAADAERSADQNDSERERLRELSLKKLRDSTTEALQRLDDYRSRLGVVTDKLEGRYPIKKDEDQDMLVGDEKELQRLISKQINAIEEDRKDRAVKIERGLLSPEDLYYLVEEDFHNIERVPPEMIQKIDPDPNTPREAAKLWRAQKALERERESGELQMSEKFQHWVRTGK